jgi:hypothetical protein
MRLLYLSFSVFLPWVSFRQRLGLGVFGIIMKVLWHFNFRFFWPVSFLSSKFACTYRQMTMLYL